LRFAVDGSAADRDFVVFRCGLAGMTATMGAWATIVAEVGRDRATPRNEAFRSRLSRWDGPLSLAPEVARFHAIMLGSCDHPGHALPARTADQWTPL